MNKTFILGIALTGLILCLGCDSGPAPSTEAEIEQLYESPEYEQQMMGGTAAGGDAAAGGATE